MERTIKIRLEPRQELISTIELYNKIKADIIMVAQMEQTVSKSKLHDLTYKHIRNKHPEFPSALIQTARDTAVECLKQNRFRNLHKDIKVRKYGAIRLDKRNLRVDLNHQIYSISSINGRIKGLFNLAKYYRDKYLDWEVQGATLKYSNGALLLHLIVKKETPEILNTDKVLGIDRGINNIAVCSNNQFFNSKKLKTIKGKYQYLKSSLQSKGTRSAKRKLKKVAGRERRFVRDLNHQLSKIIVNSDYNVFVLEDLKIKRKKKLGRKFNKKLGNWSYYQFEQFLTYKAEEKGKLVLKVDPRYTSQICSACSYKHRTNRNGNTFKCKKCGFKLHSDLNASRNIAQLGKSELSRVLINNPNVTTQNHNSEVVSYKPTNSFVGG